MEIGEPKKEITFEPIETPNEAPVEPAAPTPAEPVKEPQPA